VETANDRKEGDEEEHTDIARL